MNFLILGLLATNFSTVSIATTGCRNGGTAVYFLNGMFTTSGEARKNLNKTIPLVPTATDTVFDIAYNTNEDTWLEAIYDYKGGSLARTKARATELIEKLKTLNERLEKCSEQ